ncbi:Site-specific recombinase, resolvase family [Xenorhabdus bovienii str. oregonense]|uniref:Site-specific recombinase, resolvase family n=1 Tax=Xenorhabdus bovienii str. oregonense TaxID=1398202 RepID=A0A077PA38_XENBV|nr:recombinase family protein [Xenorhabdus bovienii]CDH07945.1 Site-specific recombinase, resolvase family [Xenorhabdus bovienii str. oregonense]
MDSNTNEKQPIKVAQYLRMSTEHQQYSLHNQATFIQDYADKHNMMITHTYDDAGKSGVTIAGRLALQKLLNDVIYRNIEIQAVLVYDVSRFGRFQDIDEAGYYNHIFKMNGVDIIFCAEHIPTKEHPLEAMLMLSIKRVGAADLSKNLSDKVYAGQVNLIKRGYHQGGLAGYGLRRQLIDEEHNPKEILSFGKRKNIQTDRVILTPGPKNERKIVNEIFDMFIFNHTPEFIIANLLNERGIKAENGAAWTRAKIHQILTNEKYIGNNIYNKTSYKLKQKFTKNPESEWIRCNKAFKPIISKKKFFLAKNIILARSYHLTNEQLLKYLKNKLEEKGKLSGFIIDEDDSGPSSSVFRSRFGGLLRAYEIIGYKPEHDYSYIQINKKLRDYHHTTIDKITKQIIGFNSIVDKIPNSPLLLVNDNLTISLLISRCKKLQSGKLRWKIRFENALKPDISIVVRMDSTNKNPVDYYIFPSLDILFEKIMLSEINTFHLEFYRFDKLDTFYQMIERTPYRRLYESIFRE